MFFLAPEVFRAGRSVVQELQEEGLLLFLVNSHLQKSVSDVFTTCVSLGDSIGIFLPKRSDSSIASGSV